jgi:hypothetical protein
MVTHRAAFWRFEGEEKGDMLYKRTGMSSISSSANTIAITLHLTTNISRRLTPNLQRLPPRENSPPPPHGSPTPKSKSGSKKSEQKKPTREKPAGLS